MRFNNLNLALCMHLLFAISFGYVFTPTVTTSRGRLRGLRSVSGQNRYYGIPYAVSKRFQPPKDPLKWNGIFNAIDRTGACAQTVLHLILGKEDCLQLDVYTPERTKPGDKLPVLVFFHGGAYYYGSKNHYDPEFLTIKNVIAVIVNYRVGVLGFLCLRGIANLGLKDQVAALKWIQKNILAFGGDPDNVTISGQSAGASSAAMHMLSQSSKGLFHKAILMSGSSLSPWAFNVETFEPAFKDASKLARVKNEEDVFEVFANSSVTDLLRATRDISSDSRYFKYSPCVDNTLSDSFFQDTPFNLIKTQRFNKVPVITGFTSLEGLLFYGLNDDKSFKYWDENFIQRLPSVFSWCSKEERKIIAKEMRAHYFGLKSIRKSETNGVINYYSDWIAYSSSNAFSDLIAKFSDQPVYNYIFAYEGNRNFAKFLFHSNTKLKGASHSDDIFYVFKPGGFSFLLFTPDKLFIDRITTMFTNFMKYGDPTPVTTNLLPIRWPASSGNASLYLRLDHQLSVTTLPSELQGDFFRQLLCTYGQSGYVPCESEQKCRPVNS